MESILAFVVRVLGAVGLSNTEATSGVYRVLKLLGNWMGVSAFGVSCHSRFPGKTSGVVHLIPSMAEGALEQFKSISALDEHRIVRSDFVDILNLLEATPSLESFASIVL